MTDKTPQESEQLLCRTADDVRQNREFESDFAAEKRIKSKRPKKRKAEP